MKNSNFNRDSNNTNPRSIRGTATLISTMTTTPRAAVAAAAAGRQIIKQQKKKKKNTVARVCSRRNLAVKPRNN